MELLRVTVIGKHSVGKRRVVSVINMSDVIILKSILASNRMKSR